MCRFDKLKTVEEIQTFFDFTPENGGFFSQVINVISDDYKDILQEYALSIDTLLITMYSNRYVMYRFFRDVEMENIEKEKNLFKTYIANLLMGEKYHFITLINSTKQEYNPIENYSMVEDGTDTNIFNHGKQHENVEYNTGAQEIKNTTEYGQQTGENQKAPYDTQTYYPNEKNTSSAYVDVNTANSGVRNDSQVTDRNGFTDDNNTEHHLTRTGNIGVTTSQQMLMSERELSDISISKIICDFIVENICTGVSVAL